MSSSDLSEQLDGVLSRAEAYLSSRNQGAVDRDLERKLRQELVQCKKELVAGLRTQRPRVRPLQREVSTLSSQVATLKVACTSALRAMAVGHLSRVGAPLEMQRAVAELSSSSNELLLKVSTLGASADTFNEFVEAMQGERQWEWRCSDEDACKPERDLLGMCPGGKPHLTEAQLEQRKEMRCYCSSCEAAEKLKPLLPRLPQAREELVEVRAAVREMEEYMRSLRRVLPRLVYEEEEDEEGDVGDPVFESDDRPFVSEDRLALAEHTRARETWLRLAQTITVSDFPLKIVFLDKSASMGGDRVTYDSLQFGLHCALRPTHGSTLTFLFAGPGETQMIFLRAGDAPPSVQLDLGCATWFNEPILQSLRFFAPVLEALDVDAWIREKGEPPLQVVCITDGADNQSSQNVRSLRGLVREIKEIAGPASGEQLYMPITSMVNDVPALQAPGNKKIPVWMMWICVGLGSQSLVDGRVPKEICLVDAVTTPQFRELPPPPEPSRQEARGEGDEEGTAIQGSQSTVASRARQRLMGAIVSANQFAEAAASTAAGTWSVGHRVRVRPRASGQSPQAGRPGKPAFVLQVLPADTPEGRAKYEIVYDNEATEVVEESLLMGAPPALSIMLQLRAGGRRSSMRGGRAPLATGLLARTGDLDEQRSQVLGLVGQSMDDMGAIIRAKSEREGKDKHGRFALEEAAAAGQRISEDAVQAAMDGVDIRASRTEAPPDPAEVLLEALQCVGLSSSKMLPEDRLVSQRYLCAGLELLVSGGALNLTHMGDQLGTFAGVAEAWAARRIVEQEETIELWADVLVRPLEDLLRMLLRRGLVESSQTAEGKELCMSTEARQAVAAVRRFFDPCSNRSGFDDASRRAVNRFQQMRRGFSFTDASTPAGRGRATSTPGKTRDRDLSKSSQGSSMASQATSCGSPSSAGAASGTTALAATSSSWQPARQQLRAVSFTDGNVSRELDKLPALRLRPLSQASGASSGRASQDGRQAVRASPGRSSSLVSAGARSINIV